MAKGESKGVDWEISILQPAIFKNVFDVSNFSIISNLFDKDKTFTP